MTYNLHWLTDLLFYSTDAGPAVHRSTKAIFKRVELFHEAIVYMILRGDKTLLADYNFIPKEPSSQPPQQLIRMSITFLSMLLQWCHLI